MVNEPWDVFSIVEWFHSLQPHAKKNPNANHFIVCRVMAQSFEINDPTDKYVDYGIEHEETF